MKLQELSAQVDEMTLRMPNADEEELKQALNHLANNANQFDHVGDINQINVLHNDEIYLFKDQDSNQFVGFAEVPTENTNALINNIYIIPSYRGKDIFAKFIWFLRRSEQYPRVILGDVHSENTIRALKRIHKRFNTYWEKDGQRNEFDPNTINNYYGIRKTGWRVVMENDGDFSDWPKYNVDNSGPYDALRKGYEGFLDPLDEDQKASKS